MFINENTSIYHQPDGVAMRKLRPVNRATARMIMPDTAKRMPAKSILLAVMSVEMPNSPNPSFIRGYAHPQSMAAVSAKTDAQRGWEKTLSRVYLALLSMIFSLSVFY